MSSVKCPGVVWYDQSQKDDGTGDDGSHIVVFSEVITRDVGSLLLSNDWVSMDLVG